MNIPLAITRPTALANCGVISARVGRKVMPRRPAPEYLHFAAVLAEADMASVDEGNGVSDDVLEVDSALGSLPREQIGRMP